MSAGRHTGGEWTISPDDSRRILSSDLNGMNPISGINTIGGASIHPDEVANARLMAAAPDLLAALKAILGEASEYSRVVAYAAIAKAEGK